MKMKVMKTTKKRKALRIHDPKKMTMTTDGPGLGGSGAGGGVASGGTSKKMSVRGGDNSKGGSNGVGSGGKFMERG